VLTPEIAGQAITGLVTEPGQDGASKNKRSYLLTAAGLSPLDVRE
jgi:hypothetical protein